MRSTRWGESGNVFFTLFGAVALVGVVGVATSTLMRGPLGTVVKLNASAKADAQMQIAHKLAMLEASQQPDSGDCDDDGFVEPLAPIVCATSPAGGGCLPSIGASQNDPWGTSYGYCAWDHGTTGDVCVAANIRTGTLVGGPETVIAIISAGPDRVFQTGCLDDNAGVDPEYIDKPTGSDDLIIDLTYAGAIQASGGLWNLQSGDPGTAEIEKNIDVTGKIDASDTVSFQSGGSFGGGAFGLSNASLEFGANSLLLLPDELASGTCNSANQGALRRDTAGGTQEVVEVCDFDNAAGWVNVADTVAGSGAQGSVMGDIQFQSSTLGSFDAAAGGVFKYVAGLLTVPAVTTTGAVNVNSGGTLDVTGATTLAGLTAGATSLGNTTTGTLGAGNTTVGTLTASGATQINNTLGVTGVSTVAAVTASGAVLINNTLTVAAFGTTLGGTLTVAGDITDSNGAVIFSDADGVDITAGNLNVTNDIFGKSFQDINSGLSPEGIFFNSADGLELHTEGSKALEVDASGDIGIGLAGLPTTQLDVGGEIRFRSVGHAQGEVCVGLYGSLTYSSSDKFLVCSSETNVWETIGTSGGGGSAAGDVWLDEADYIRYENSSYIVKQGQTLAFSSALEGAGTRFLWYPSAGSFRAGTVTGTQWDEAQQGTNSAAFGNDTIASGVTSFAAGDRAQATTEDAIALGAQVEARATQAIALGNQAVVAAGATNSMALGLGSTAGASPQITGVNSLGVFMGDQGAVDLSAANTMVLAGGKLVIDPATPATQLAVSLPNLALDVEGDIGAIKYCDENGVNCFLPSDVAAGSSPGADTELVFNSGGVFGTDPNLIFISATNSLGINTGVISLSSLKLDVEGDVGAINYCDEDGLNCFTASDVSGGGGTAPGANREIVYNSNGKLHADSAFTFTAANRLVFASVQNVFVTGGNDTMTGFSNTAIGSAALNDNTTGSLNTAVGVSSLRRNTTGSNNIAVGSFSTLSYNTTGSHNLGMGRGALLYNTIGGNNTSIGSGAGQGVLNSTDVSGNVFMGYAAASNILTGANSNVVIGESAAASLTTGAKNIIIGKSADVAVATDSNYLNIGNAIFGNVGQGAADPRVGSFKYCDENLANCFLPADVANNSVPGADTEILFNSGGVMGTDPGFVFVSSTGRMGIGIAAPSTILHVKNPGEGGDLAIFESDGQLSVTIATGSLGTNHQYGKIKFAGSTNISGDRGIGGIMEAESANDIYQINDAIMIFDTTSAGGVASVGNLYSWNENDVSHMIMDHSGSVAIGDPVPDLTLLLDVDGQVGATEYCDETGLNCFTASDVSGGSGTAPGANREIVYNSGGQLHADNAFTFTSANRLVFSNSNNVFIAGGNDTTSGSYNTALGTIAFQGNSSGSYNTAIGSIAMQYNTTGSNNTAVGLNALKDNTTGTQNTGVGRGALVSNTTGGDNTAVGMNALPSNTESDGNSAFGMHALRYYSTSNTGFTYNTSIGYRSLYGVDGSTTGERNTALGGLSGDSITTGDDNILIGYNADLPAPTTNEYLNIGNLLYGDIGTTSTDPKIGTAKYCDENLVNCFTASDVSGGSGTAPGANREIVYNSNGSLHADNAFTFTAANRLVFSSADNVLITGGNDTMTGDFNTVLGRSALSLNTTGDSNTAVGSNALAWNSTGKNNAAVGRGALFSNTTGIQNTAVGFAALDSNKAKSRNTAIGFQAMRYADDTTTTSDANNTALGSHALMGSTTAANNTGVNNTALGSNALRLNTTGWSNAATGLDALYNNTTGSRNSAIGTYALNRNTTGWDNTATGFNALYTNKAKSKNTAIGYEAMRYADDTTTAGDANNTAVGYQALYGSTTAANNTGTNNTAIGMNALYSNTTGSHNVAVGSNALYLNPAGKFNVAIGHEALYSNTAWYNVGMGYHALYNNTTGSMNTGIGFEALLDNINGWYNVGIGRNALHSNISGSNNAAVGIDALAANTTGYDNTGIGLLALAGNTEGFRNTALGRQAGESITTGDYNIIIGYNVDTPLPTTSNYLNIGDIFFGSGTGTTAGSKVGAVNYCDENLANCFAATDVGAAAATAINDLSDAIYDGSSLFLGNGSGANDDASANVNLGVGKDALASNTTGYKNTASGYQALFSNLTGYANTATGHSALLSNTTGYYNTAFGYQALEFNTTGNWNVASGYRALYVNVDGNYNTATGTDALRFNSSGDYNTATGKSALRNNTTGHFNVASGAFALNANTTGNSNVASGYSALANNTTGFSNVASGYQALYNNTTGTYNVAVGRAAGGNTAAPDGDMDGNALFGYQTGYNIEGGAAGLGANYNTLLGYQAGDLITLGDNNIMVGKDTDPPLATTSNYLNVGDIFFGTGVGTTAGSKVGAVNYCDENLANCFAATDVGSSTAPGANREIVYNSNGSLHADNAFTFTAANRLVFSSAASVFVAGGNDTTSGWYNTAVGFSAFSANTSGGNNTAIGAEALKANTTGYDSIAVGAWALVANTTGSKNSATGMGALTSNTTGSENTASGANALNRNTESDGNVAFGMHALQNFATTNTGYTYNTAIGTDALKGVNGSTTGERNTALGGLAGDSITTGNDNILIGYNADLPAPTTSNYLNIGDIFFGSGTGTTAGSQVGAVNYCDENLANCFVATDVGGAAGLWTSGAGDIIHYNSGTPLVGIGTITPTEALDVVGNVKLSNHLMLAPISSVPEPASSGGGGAAGLWTDGAGDIIHYNSGTPLVGIGTITPTEALDVVGTMRSDILALVPAVGAAVPSSSASGGGLWTAGVADDIYYNSGSTPKVGIGTTLPAQALDVVGNIQMTGILIDKSDRRLKTDITPLQNDENTILARLDQIGGYSFRMKDDETGQIEYGVIAQEVERVFPELVLTEDDEMGTKSVNYVGLIAPLIEATKELKAENETLKEALESKGVRLAVIEARMESFESDMAGMKAHTGYSINKASIGLAMMFMIIFMGGGLVVFLRRKEKI